MGLPPAGPAEEKQALLFPHRRIRLPLLLLSLLALVAGPVSAQEASDVILDSSEEVFAVLCAARAAGVTPALGRPGSSVAMRVESALARLDPAVTAPLRAYFADKSPNEVPASLSPFISLALVLGPAPTFEVNLPRDHVPPDAFPLLGFVPLVRTFYEQADLGALRKQLLPRYDRAAAERGASIGRQLTQTRGYLRLIGEITLGRTYTIYLEWLAPPALVSARSYGEDYTLVLHPERADLLEAVRHQYLHFLLDPVAVKFASEMNTMARLQPVVVQAPRLAADFRQDTLLLVTESLIQAVELRLHKLQPAAVAARMLDIESTGFIFARHFYDALDRFEQAEPSIRFYFPELLHGYDAELERQRLAKVDFSAAPSSTAMVELTSEAEDDLVRLLVEAESLLARGDYPAARAAFERILQEVDPEHPAAFFGLGIVASAEQDRDAAKRNFERVLAGNPEAHLLGWSHVYLGRIYDLEGSRDKALEHYRAALALNTHQERIERAARRGLEQPFGEQ